MCELVSTFQGLNMPVCWTQSFYFIFLCLHCQVTVIVAGTVRWKRYLDYLIMSLCSEEKVFREMEPLLLQVFLSLSYLLKAYIFFCWVVIIVINSTLINLRRLALCDFRYWELAFLKFSSLMYQLMLPLMRYADLSYLPFPFPILWN